MIIDAIQGNLLWESVYALGIIAISVALAFALLWIFKRVVTRITARTKSTLDDFIFNAVRSSLVVWVVVQGVFIALTAVTFLDDSQNTLNKGWTVAVTALVFWTLKQVVAALVSWYASEIASKTETSFDDRALPILNRVIGVVILALGILAVLQELGVSISPLLAGLGIGGLAVALAVQPTLSNFLSGTYVLSDGSIRTGDFIEVQGGPSGTVQGVGWRATRILTPQNNLVVVPNSKLSDSIVTNFNLPDQSTTVVVTNGVSYESDLQQVETVAIDEMQKLAERMPQVDRNFKPVLLFQQFGDSNITFACVMRAVNRGSSFGVQHELIKAIYRRFREEGIEINYPMRKVVFADGAGQAAPTLGGRTAAQLPPPRMGAADDDAADLDIG